MNRILVVGTPRSGTTWLAHALGVTPGARLVKEPDNTAFNADAAEAHALYGGYPVPHPGEQLPAYARLWDPVLLATPRATVHVVAKSVQSAFAMDWLIDRYQPRVVLIERHPVRVVASWMRLGFVVGDLATRPRIQTEHVERMHLPRWQPSWPRLVEVSWAVGVLMTALRMSSRAHTDWTVVSHELFSTDPVPRLRSLAQTCGLQWLEETEVRIRELGEARIVPVEPGADGVPACWTGYRQEDARAALAVLRHFPELAQLVGGPDGGGATSR